MATEPTGDRAGQLEDVFNDDVTGGGAGGVTTAAAAPAPATAPAEIEMPPVWVGQGNPPRPQQVHDDIASKQQQAEALRQRSAQLTAQEQKLDADVNVANQLLAARTEEHQQLQDRMNTLHARETELVGDAARNSPDVTIASDQVNAIKRQLGEPVPSDELMPPEGQAPPAPVTPETDPAKIAVLRQQLTDAQAKLDRVVAEQPGPSPELERLKAEQATLAPQLQAAERALDLQRTSTTELTTRAESLEADSVASLDKARGLEAEAGHLTDALPDYQQVWDTWAAEHPDQAKVTDLGTVDVKVPPRETAAAYAQGRREEAGRLEQQASDADKAAADAGNGSGSRIELAQRNEQTAAELTQRADTATTRATALQSQADAAHQQAEKLGTDSDRMRAEAAQLRSSGRTDAADTMDARAKAMTEDSIKAQFRAGDLEQEAKSLTESSATAQSQATALTAQATSLRTEATELATQQSALQQQATKLREDATTRDHVAQQVEDQLQTGQPFHFKLVDDRMGESIDLDVPAGPPPYSADATTGANAADGGAGTNASDPAAAGVAGADGSDGATTTDPLVAGDDITGAAPVASADASPDALATTADDPSAAVTTPDATPDVALSSGDDALAATDTMTTPTAGFDDPAPSDSAPSDFAPSDDTAVSAVDSGTDGLDA